jgi:MYXO-CTERM domain-containing protein
MSRRFSRVLGAISLSAATALCAATAAAHISLDQGGTHKSRYGDNDLKEGPCGMAGGGRSANVYTYAPGATVPVTIVEFIPHPSYFRIAFDDDGDDGFVPPASIEPIDPMRACPFNAADKCGAPDYYNSPTVLPDMDDLNPHASASFGQKYTWNVKLPHVECDNCTLQIIQVMEDTIHGAYNPVKGDPNDNPYVDDIYYQCIDLVLQKGADPGMGIWDDGSGSPADAGDAPKSSGDNHGKAAAPSDSGCTLSRRSPATPSSAALVALALVALASRRRR